MGETVRDRVRVYVFRTQSRFTRCAGCDRVYWRATP
ncbi:MAG TPA: Mut7-C RNAse domain-containing protein [Candidatus Cryosericum sp.]|nr:Mut7-C RNAse domain-containing protein [Candidatus Cryosericum sp.]